jgi:hypothetical protein
VGGLKVTAKVTHFKMKRSALIKFLTAGCRPPFWIAEDVTQKDTL